MQCLPLGFVELARRLKEDRIDRLEADNNLVQSTPREEVRRSTIPEITWTKIGSEELVDT